MTTQKFNNVQKLVYKMVTENTGVHFLDSGLENGRMWQRNSKKTIQDFYNEPEELYTYDNTYNEVQRTVSVFHYLSGLDLDDVCNKFNRRQGKDWEGNNGALEDCYGVSERASNWLQKNYEVEIDRTWNTYNGDSDLSQILQGSNLKIFNDGQEEEYILIQVHGGADARGGYTDAKLFKLSDYRIHGYLREYADSYELKQDLEEGYIDNVEDCNDKTISYRSAYILARINTETIYEAISLMFQECKNQEALEAIQETLKMLVNEGGFELEEYFTKVKDFCFDPNQLSLELV
jgi:hypothetical protein